MNEKDGWKRVPEECECENRRKPNLKAHFCLGCGKTIRESYLKDFPDFISSGSDKEQLIWVLKNEIDLLKDEVSRLEENNSPRSSHC